MSDIIIETPWHCGDRDCGWHQATYWTTVSGFSLTSSSDDDHEDCEEGDLPSPEEVDAAWEDYRKHVATTGDDPLGQYVVRGTYNRRARFVAEFRNGIGGAIFCRWRRGRGAWSFGPPPALLRDYLHLVDDFAAAAPAFRRWVLKDYDPETGKRENYAFAELLDMAAADENVTKITRPERRFVRVHLLLEERVPRSESAMRRELRRMAGRRPACAKEGGER
jgi:hypothetical protein